MDEAFLTVEYFLKEFKVCGQGHKEKNKTIVMGESAVRIFVIRMYILIVKYSK